MSDRIIDTGLTEGDLLEALAAEMMKSQRQPGDVTTKELKAKTGKSEEKCRQFLKAKVGAGELEEIQLVEQGHLITVYRRVVK